MTSLYGREQSPLLERCLLAVQDCVVQPCGSQYIIGARFRSECQSEHAAYPPAPLHILQPFNHIRFVFTKLRILSTWQNQYIPGRTLRNLPGIYPSHRRNLRKSLHNILSSPLPYSLQISHHRACHHFRINLRGADRGMTEQLLHSRNRHALMDEQDGAGVAAGMPGGVLPYPGHRDQPGQ